MSLRSVFVFFLVIPMVFFSTAAFAGRVELTTYYPAPHGEYKTLKASESVTAKGADQDNTKVVVHAGGSTGTGLAVTNANRVGIGTATPEAVLDISSTASGFLPPRMTTAQRNAITLASTPPLVKGMMIYNTDADVNTVEVWNGTEWKRAFTGGGVWHTTTQTATYGSTVFLAIGLANFITQKPTGTCICSDSAVIGAVTPKTWGGFLERKPNTSFYLCDDDTSVFGCKASTYTHMHYLAFE